MNKCYIIGTREPEFCYGDVPFVLFARCISYYLTENNIYNEITKNLRSIKDTDIIIVFQPWFSNIPSNLKCKIIYINSESVFSKKIINEINSNNNIIQVWDYSLNNINEIQQKSNLEKHQIKHIPPCYHPCTRNHFNDIVSHLDNGVDEKDIDFLFFGTLNDRRTNIFNQLTEKGYVFKHIQSLDYKEIYNYIKRSRIILIINYYEHNLPVDIYRLFFLIPFKAFVINEDVQKEELENKEKYNKLIFSPYGDEFIETCEKYIKMSQTDRDNIVNNIYDWYKCTHSIEKYIDIDTLKSFIE